MLRRPSWRTGTVHLLVLRALPKEVEHLAPPIAAHQGIFDALAVHYRTSTRRQLCSSYTTAGVTPADGR